MKVLNDGLKVVNILPPVFICFIIGVIWSTYMGMHLLWLLQVHLPHDFRDAEATSKGKKQLAISQVLITMLLVCYTRAFLTSPGSVSESDEWKLTPRGDVAPRTREVKVTGKRRHCKWCLHFKPDRCHHCRVCKTCVLRMDHHCPWIMNCVGFRNHKYFFLLVFYTVLNCGYVSFTLLESVHRSTVEEMPSSNRFLLVFGLVLSLIMGTLMSVFFTFHFWLMTRNMSTIEFCEKTSATSKADQGRKHPYHRGLYGNICAVLGPQPLLWLLPVAPPLGDGMHWPGLESEEEDSDPEWTPQPASAL